MKKTLLLALALIAVVPVALDAQVRRPFRVGVIRYKTDELVRDTYTPFAQYLAGELGTVAELTILPVELVPGEEIDDEAIPAGEELAYMLSQGEFDLGIFKPFPYLQAKIDHPELEVFATHLIEGAPTYLGAIFVRADSGIETLADLRGRSFVFTKETSTSGYRYPRGVLREHEIDIDEDFSEYNFSNNHVESLQRVLSGDVDGTAVDHSAFYELSEEERGLLRKLEEYEVPYQAYVLSPAIGDDERNQIESSMFDAHRTSMTRSRLFNNGLGIESWVSRADLDYNSLRRYLGIMRSKPSLMVTLQTMASAEASLAQRGDLLDALQQDLVAELALTQRFLEVSEGTTGAEHIVTVNLSMIDDRLTCRTSLDGQRIDSFECTDMLQERLARRTAVEVLSALPLGDHLQHNGERWFFTHGRNDGIQPETYQFSVETSTGSVIELAAGAVEEVTRLNTYFAEDPLFERGMTVMATYDVDLQDVQQETESQLPGFWNNLDNRWGVIGLGIALLTGILGTYIGSKKRRIFRNLLDESNELVMNLLEGKTDLDRLLREQGEKIGELLHHGDITENQFLILNHRLEEIREVVKRLFTDESLQAPEVMSGLREILGDGKITEREYRQLLHLVDRAGEQQEV